MKILHLYPKSDDMITRHVAILMEGMSNSAEVKAVNSLSEFKACFRQMQPDIVHCHSCWQYTMGNAASIARRHGARIVISPHGQLEPWVFEEKPVREKIHKTLMWQKRYVSGAYAVIAFGKMEHSLLQKLKWNSRIEIIRNSLITNSISPQQMCSQTFAVYQKVLDSNTLELMDETTKRYLSLILKTSITGDRRWIQNEGIPSVEPNWRQLLIYADHQNIRNYVDYGMSILQIPQPALDTTKITAYFPEHYKRPQPIREIIGEYNGKETDYMVRIIAQLSKRPVLLHLIELACELHRDNVNDDELQEVLQEKSLWKDAARLMQVLSELTLLEEGYMPLPPLDDRGTRQIRTQITTHLKL